MRHLIGPGVIAAARFIPSLGGVTLLWAISRVGTTSDVAIAASVISAALGVSLFARLGFDIIGIKHLPVLFANRDIGSARAFLRFFSIRTLVLTWAIVAAIWALNESFLPYPLETGLCAAGFSMLVIASISLRARERTVASTFAETGYTLLLTAAVVILWPDRARDIPVTKVLASVSLVHALLAVAFSFLRIHEEGSTSSSVISRANGESWTFLVISSVGYLYAQGYVWIGATQLSVDDTAALGVISRLVFAVNFSLVIANAIYNQKYALALHKGDLARVEVLASESLRMMLVFALPPVVAILLFSDPLLQAFNVYSDDAALALSFMVVAQFINVVTGNSAAILNLSGNQNAVRNCMAAVSIVSLLFAFPIAMRFGLLGFCTTFACAISVQNLILMLILQRRLGINLYRKRGGQ